MFLTDPATIAELRSLAERYASGVDRLDPDLFASAFAPDAELIVTFPGATESSVRRGTAELRETVDGLRRFTRTMHFLGQTVYEATEDGAHGEVYCIASHLRRRDKGDTNLVMYIRYHDDYRVGADGRWVISTRRVDCEWNETHQVDALAPTGVAR